MNRVRKGWILAAVQALIALSLTGKLYYDRATCPRVWVKTARWDPDLPIRGRYLALRLVPEPGAAHVDETKDKQVLFFVPEHPTELEKMGRGPAAPEVWAEVTIPRKGPPRPIRLGIKTAGTIQPLAMD